MSMKKCLFLGMMLSLGFSTWCFGQLENIIVEIYYISDQYDATDTTCGHLEEGSVTYRIYADLVKGSKVTKIYGDKNHRLKIASTEPFFNHKTEGVSFGKDLSKSRLKEDVVALDTWLTLSMPSKSHVGVQKINDADGSIIGGTNNDGGSAGISGGLLVNTDTDAGIPLTTADGLLTPHFTPSNWIDKGIVEFGTGNDSTIFGSLVSDTVFVSYDAFLGNSGAYGPTDENRVLLAQLTTKGDLSFELNLVVSDSTGKTYTYVARDSILLPDELLRSYLKYPLPCGCTDPNYLEFDKGFGCEKAGACKTPIVIGCMDPAACNYNSSANFPLDASSQVALCCYPGSCNDRDISVVCPNLSIGDPKEDLMFALFPNPAGPKVEIRTYTILHGNITCIVYDMFGRSVMEKQVSSNGQNSNTISVDVSLLSSGSYILRLLTDEYTGTQWFIKK
ncbi:MAG: T9SS type A sorting domain-containing protein [Flavobacteriales bacterium]|nr:T9SS type A sorting domain-containing protein [Flavobacteriales bacterium]